MKLEGLAVAAEKSSDVSLLQFLQSLGLSLVTELDTLAFLYSHSVCLCTAAQIAGLIGYEEAEIGSALHRLEEVGLIHRSRNAEGRRLYRFSEPSESERHSCLRDLMSLTQNRTGRLLLLKHLRRPRQERRRNRGGGLRLA